MSIVLEQNTWRMSSTYFVFIVTSRDSPIYEQFDSMRRLQMNSLGIPHKFLINGSLPSGYALQSDEEYFEDASFNPGMFMKFYSACKEFASKYILPDFIVRINSSTFIDFEKFQRKFLNNLPKTGFVGGPIVEENTVPRPFISGTIMMFSKDIIYKLVNNVDINHPYIREYNDDVALSYIISEMICNQFCQFINQLIVYNQITYENYRIELPEHAFIIRIKNDVDREKNDIFVWKELIKLSGITLKT
jgi:hypothetical protein